jgi:gluconokinase
MTIAVVMGVSGSGKTTIAAGLAKRLGWILLEGDSFHPPANIAKMKAGIPLTDEDRWPWLKAIAAEADKLTAAGQSAAIACSALKRAYRDILIDDRPDTLLIYLRGSRTVIGDRMAARKGHYMPTSLLDSQLATLEEPGPAERPIVVDVDQSADAIIDRVVEAVKERVG